MKTNLALKTFIMFISILTIFFISWKEYDPESDPTCEDYPNRNGKISINFNAGPNTYRNSTYAYYVPSPDMRFGDIPGQNTFDQTKFLCTVSITSPNCSSFQFHKSFENPGNILDVELPPAGYDITVKVTYIEKGEDATTINFNKPAFDMFGNSMNYSRVKYEFQQTYMGWPSSSVAQPIFLNPTLNEGYNVDPATGKIQGVSGGNKVDLGDISGINAYIDLGF